MRTRRKVDAVWAAIAILLVCLAMAFMSGCDDEEAPLEIGQVWEWKFNDNPFKDSVMAKRKILALRDGYVEYERVDEDSLGMVDSMRERVFRAGGAKLITGERPVKKITLTGRPEPDIHPQWGKGDLSPEYIKFFGNSNGSRLDFMQNQAIDRHGEIIKEMAIRILILEGADPNDVRLERTG